MGVISDDLTGCGDVGVQFADRGLKVFISVSTDSITPPPSSAEVWIINTDSRSFSPNKAARAVRRATVSLKDWNPDYYYKKIDSTLRGNVGAELEAFMDELGLDTLSLCAAFPKMGRTTSDGVQYVNGVRLEDTEFSKDIANPVRSSGIAMILAEQMENPSRVRIIDAETDDEMVEISSSESGCCYAGASAWSGFLADFWMQSGRNIIPAILQPGPVLIVSGSLHPASVEQVDYWRGSGRDISDDISDTGLSDGKDILVSTVSEESSSALKKLVKRALHIYSAGCLKRIVLNGGETSSQFLKEVGVEHLEVIKSLMPGIALTRCSDAYIILKPGGYGEPSTLADLADILNGR